MLISRAARDLAGFFHHVPYRSISWAIPCLPGGFTNQLVISRIVPDTEALAPIAARFTLLHRRPTMGRVVPRPQPVPSRRHQLPQQLRHQPRGLRTKEHLLSALSAEVTGQEQVDSVQEPPLAPRAVSIVSSSQPTFTPPGSETAGAEAEIFEEGAPDISTTEQLPVESTQLEPPSNRQEHNTLQDQSTEAELHAGTAASRGEASEAHQSDSIGPNNAE